MSDQTIFLIALQSGLVLGLVHGINPCGHSWVVLAPFVAGDSSGWRVTRLTCSFVLGTAFGCLVIAVALGMLSAGLPDSARHVVDIITAGIIMLLGLIMIIRPHLLHNHDHDHHDHEHGHGCACSGHSDARLKATTAWGLASLGFVNVIVPCPTLAMMYSYAIDAASILRAVGVFAAYALGTAVSLAGVILVIYRVTKLIQGLRQPWIEGVVMRLVGLMTLVFGGWSFYLDLV